MRAIAEVATAVTKGDLTRSIKVDARGEVAELKDNINTMIDNLRLTTERNTEQDWLKTNLARFTNMLQGQRDLTLVGKMLLSELAPLVGAHQGVIYQVDADESQPFLSLLSVYAQGVEAAHPPRSTSARASSANAPVTPAASSSPIFPTTWFRSLPACSRLCREARSCCRCISRAR